VFWRKGKSADEEKKKTTNGERDVRKKENTGCKEHQMREGRLHYCNRKEEGEGRGTATHMHLSPFKRIHRAGTRSKH
jgi:hypothetical protein